MKKGIISVLSAITGAVVGAGTVGKMAGRSLEKAEKMSDKHLALFLMMNQWVKVKQAGKGLSSFFEKNGYNRIAIYGMSYAGETLVNELKDSEIQVAYGIDKNADVIYADIRMVTLEDNLDDVDAIIVTAVTFFDEIKRQLCEKIDCPILSLEDILYEI